jgi:hypothetical protein
MLQEKIERARVVSYHPAPGDVVVMRDLPRNQHEPTWAPLSPRLGRLERKLADGRWFVRLHQRSFTGSQHLTFAKKGRVIEAAHIDRPATRRELTLGAVIDHVTERAA